MTETDRRVLVADDDPAVRGLLEQVFKRAGFTADLCKDGREAFAKLGGAIYDLLVFDLNMPAINGLDLARMARLAGISTPVILISGAPDAAAEAQLQELDALRVLPKPFHPDELLRLAGRMMGTMEQNTPPSGNPLVS